MQLYTNQDSQELLQALNDALPYIEYVLKTHKPLFDGERYLTSEELCSILKISRRTLQDWKDLPNFAKNGGFLGKRKSLKYFNFRDLPNLKFF